MTFERGLEAYEKGLKIIDKLKQLPDVLYFNGVKFTKYFYDTNLSEFSKYRIVGNSRREVCCSFTGNFPLGKRVTFGTACTHFDILGDFYMTNTLEEDILNKVLNEESNMNSIEHTLLTGEVKLDSDKDGNVVILQNKQEIKLTLSQVLEVKSYFDCVIDAVAFVSKKESS